MSSNADPDLDRQRFAMKLSLGVGFAMLAAKVTAYFITGSVAILSDAAESVVHIAAVAFAAYSLWLSQQPADRSHLYGHDRITYFSAGFEGAMIVVAAAYILSVAIQKWLTGLQLDNPGPGVGLILLAAVLNAGLGSYLVWVGKRQHSLILEANGKHVLTDSWTSFGVVAGLGLAVQTGWLHFDPLVAVLVASNILWSGGKLIRRSIAGLMDEVDPQLEREIERSIERLAVEHGVKYHGLRHRSTGNTLWIEFHLLFPKGIPLESAHHVATRIEESLERQLPVRAEITSHLETLEDHQQVHSHAHYEQMSD